jgi:hypothetical protein
MKLRQVARLRKRRLRRKRTLAELLSAMPNVGRDEDFDRHALEARWRSEHAQFVAAHNATVEVEGLPLEAGRTF